LTRCATPALGAQRGAVAGAQRRAVASSQHSEPHMALGNIGAFASSECVAFASSECVAFAGSERGGVAGTQRGATSSLSHAGRLDASVTQRALRDTQRDLRCRLPPLRLMSDSTRAADRAEGPRGHGPVRPEDRGARRQPPPTHRTYVCAELLRRPRVPTRPYAHQEGLPWLSFLSERSSKNSAFLDGGVTAFPERSCASCVLPSAPDDPPALSPP
jgi:hypothetical protein